MAEAKVKPLTAYCMATKTKDTAFHGTPEITKSGNRYMVKGVDKDGNGMCKIIGQQAATEAITAGIAKKSPTDWN